MLEVKDIHFSYNRDAEVLKGISLNLRPGEIRAVIGRNGSGKTTLFSNILALEKPTKGQIYYQGERVQFKKKFLKSYRQKVNMVMQNPDKQIFHSRVLDDVALGPINLGKDRQEAEAIGLKNLEKLGIGNLKEKSTHTLSYGQKKRVAIAGVLAMACECLLLDEPTAGLDPELSLEMEKLLLSLKKEGKGLLISSHDMDFIYAVSDYVYIINGGKIIKEGKKEIVFLDNNIMEGSGLNQPWLVRAHLETGLPLFKDEIEFFKYISEKI